MILTIFNILAYTVCLSVHAIGVVVILVYLLLISKENGGA